MTDKLLPCPFCGGEAEHFGGGGQHSIRCKQCGITNERIRKGEAMYEAYDTSEEAIAAWNRRADHIRDTTKKVSNADRIRSMSDEELAKIITSDLIGELIPFCQNKYECDAMLTINTIPEEWCMKCALDWLKEEHNEAD